MGAVTRPVGPLPPQVYWVRRLAALVVLVLVAVIAYAVVRVATGGDEASGNDAGGTVTAPASPAADGADGAAGKDGTADGDGSADDAGTGGDEKDAAEGSGDAPADDADQEATATPEGAATPECTKADVSVALRSDASTYRAKADPVFTMDVTNVSDAPCLVDVTDDTRELLIVSGPARVWSSADCGDPDARLLLLGPGQVDSQELTWPRVRSDEKCSSTDAVAAPGTYRATVSLLGRSTEELVFVLG